MTLYSDLKIFHFPQKIDNLGHDMPVTAPVHIRLKPTNKCNHRCRYCAYRSSDLQLGKDMRIADTIPQGKMFEICKDIVAMGVKAVTFSGGGEPLMYPYLLEGARILKEGGVRLACLTNGALLQGDVARFFSQNAAWIRISMDGWDDASYRRYRGIGDGEYSKIMRNLLAFSALGGDCVLGVSYIIDAENYTHIPEVLRRYKDIGVRSVKLSACITSNDAERANEYHAPHFHYVQDAIRQSQELFADQSFEIVDAWHAMGARFHKDYDWCPYSQILTVIGADLGIYPCQDKAYNDEALLGSLRGQRLREWWFENKDAFFKIHPNVHCRHHCVANGKNMMLHEYLSLVEGHTEFV